MRVIARKRLREFAQRHPDATEPLENWSRLVRAADWQSVQEVRRVYRHADAVAVGSGKTATVFNIGGNKHRLVTAMHYNTQRVYVLRFMTHAEYSKGLWKDSL